MNFASKTFNSISPAHIILLLLIMIPAVVVQAQHQETYDLVIINGDTISSSDVDAEIIRNHTAMESPQSIDFKNFLNKLVNDRLILQEAYGIGLDQEPRFAEWAAEQQKKFAVDKYVKSVYNTDLTISDDEVREEFNKYYYKMQFRTVFSETEEGAQKIYDAIKAGAPMDSVAKASTIGPRSVVGGLQDLKFYSELPVELREPGSKMKEGELAGPLKFRAYYVVFRLEKREDPTDDNFAMLKETLRKNMRREQLQARWETFVDSMVSTNPVLQNDSLLNAIKADESIVLSKEFVKPSDLPVLWLDDKNRVTENELRTEISRSIMQAAQTPFEQIMEKAITNKSLDIIFGFNATKNGFLVDQDVLNKLYISVDSALIDQYIKEFVVEKIVFKQTEFQDYYDTHLEDFRAPEEIMIAQRIVSTKDSAQMVIDRVNGGADFRYLAKQLGLINSAADGDDQWLKLESFPQMVANDISNLKIGQVCGPYDVGTGYMIINLRDKRPGEIKPIEDVDVDIRQVMFQKKFNQILDENLKILKENSEIKYNDKNIEKYFNN